MLRRGPLPLPGPVSIRACALGPGLVVLGRAALDPVARVGFGLRVGLFSRVASCPRSVSFRSGRELSGRSGPRPGADPVLSGLDSVWDLSL